MPNTAGTPLIFGMRSSTHHAHVGWYSAMVKNGAKLTTLCSCGSMVAYAPVVSSRAPSVRLGDSRKHDTRGARGAEVQVTDVLANAAPLNINASIVISSERRMAL